MTGTQLFCGAYKRNHLINDFGYRTLCRVWSRPGHAPITIGLAFPHKHRFVLTYNPRTFNVLLHGGLDQWAISRRKKRKRDTGL